MKNKKSLKEFKPYSTLWIMIGIAVFVIIALFIVPSAKGLVQGFAADNYYQIVSGIIAGAITLIGLAWQFAREHKRIHEETMKEYERLYMENQQIQEKSRIETRGIFEVGYSGKRPEVKRVATTNGFNRANPYSWFFYIKLRNEKHVYDCFVKFIRNDGGTPETVSVGVVFPSEDTAIQTRVNLKNPTQLRIVIIYRTIMGEIIRHEFESNEPCNPEKLSECQLTEKMLCKLSDEQITTSNLDSLIESNEFELIFESHSRILVKS